MHKTLSIGFVLGVLLGTVASRAEGGHLCAAKRAAASACPCVIMEGGAGTRGVTGGYTIAPMRSCAVKVGCHRFARVCKVPGYAVATRWSIYGCGGFGCSAFGGCGSCGYGDGGCGSGCGGGCGEFGDCGSCGSGCGAGCGSGCGGEGCSGCADGAVDGETYTGESGETIIHDGPVNESAPEPAPTSEASLKRGSRYRLVSNARADGSAAFEKGLSAFRSRSLTDALQDFESASNVEPDNAMYHYMRALTLFDLNGADAGGDALRQAVEAERREPVAQWGKRMERVQGKGRVWIEKARREAGLVR